MKQTVIKTCTKCRRPYGVRQWVALPLDGYMDDGTGGRLELRTCPCGSTLAIAPAMLEVVDREPGVKAALEYLNNKGVGN